MLRVSNPTSLGSGVDGSSFNGFFSIDKRKKQVTLTDPSICSGSLAPEDRRVGVAAPKMFAFDAIFSQDDSQTELCSSALTDVVHAVINGTDGCIFCFGQAGLGKSYTMLGSPESANTVGIIPCAITWLFKGINEQRQKTGARFSVRVSAVEICGPTNQLKDLLARYANDSEQSPGMYLRDDHLFGNQPPHCELRVPSAEKAAHYLDAAIDCRSCHREDSRDSHFLFTLHVYQYSVAGKGGVAGGRSRLHLIDLGNSDRGKYSGGIPLSGVGNIILAIFNGQKHLPYKEHKLTHLLKECLGSVTCHATMIAHVSPLSTNYLDTLTTVQLASRIHRMRRKRIKFVSTATGNGSGGSSGEDGYKAAGTSSEPDPSSSDLSADTVIYVGRADDATDGEHPPVYIPSLNSGDNRCSMIKALRGSIAEQKPQCTKAKSEDKTIQQRNISRTNQSHKSSPTHNSSTKSSPGRKDAIKTKTESPKYTKTECSDEQWIDGPRVSKSKVVEAFHLMKEKCHVRKCETWIDGPMKEDGTSSYGYMDSHKKNMIRKWVEHQTIQIQKSRHVIPRAAQIKLKDSMKELTQFKSSEQSSAVTEDTNITKPNVLNKVETQEIQHKINKPPSIEEDGEDEDEPKLPPALPLIQPLSSREVSLESLDQILKDRMISNAEYNNYQKLAYEETNSQDEILEIIEVEEPLEPVPTQDSCLQVTEEDIALCMGYLENPLPEDDQESPLDHPLRILSQENLTAISNFTDSMSALNELERILPRYHLDMNGYYNDYEDVDNPSLHAIDDPSNKKLNQLTRLHELYSHELSKAKVGHPDYFKSNNKDKSLTRCESLTLADMLFGSEKERNDDGSIYSEPVYVQQKFCENCKINMCGPTASQNWHMDSFFSSTQNIYEKSQLNSGGGFQKYNHNQQDNLSNLRHPDGASNPNLGEELTTRLPGNGAYFNAVSDFVTTQPLPPPNSLPSAERLNRAILNLETGIAAIKLSRNLGDGGQKIEEYDSGHDSTPRTSKHSPAAISRRAESGYDSIVRDSESSSIDSEQSRIFHNRRGKCKHKHDKSFCSWFLNPFTCKHFEEPPETHF